MSPADYNAATEYGTRNSERNKKIVRFGRYKITLYQRGDVGQSSWYFRVYIKEESRNYRQSLNTTDLNIAENNVQQEMINILTRVGKGERLLALELKDLLRKFKLECERAVAADELAKTTWMNHLSRINHGVEFLKTKYKRGLETKLTEIDGKTFFTYPEYRLGQNKEAGRSLRKDVIRDELLIIRKMFKFGLQNSMLSEKNIPKWDIVVEKSGPKRERVTPSDFKTFWDITGKWVNEGDPNTRYHRVATLHVTALVAISGMRSGEVFGLKNKDIAMKGDECLVHIRAETSKVRQDRDITVRTKAFKQWIARQKFKDSNDYVFSPLKSGRVSIRDTFYHQYKTLRVLLKEKGIEWMDLYHMRHFYITSRLLSEEPIHLIAKVAGTSVAEIESTYSHVMTAMTTKRFNRKSIVFDDDGDYKIIVEELKKV